MAFFHLMVSIISIGSFLFLNLENNYQIGLLTIALISFINFIREFFKQGAEKLEQVAAEAKELTTNYALLPSKKGTVLAKKDSKTLYEEIYFELENGDKFFALCPQTLSNKLEAGDKVTFYFHKIFIVHVEPFIEQKDQA